MQRVTTKYENQLDIRSLIKTRLNLILLLKLILSDQQQLLFKHHRKGAISMTEMNGLSCSSMEVSSDELGQDDEGRSLHFKF